MTETRTTEGWPVCWVTGAQGFIGRHLVRRLAAGGNWVIGFGRSQATGSSPTLSAYFEGGLTVEALDSALVDFGPPSAVYHLAGGSTVGASITNPLRDFQSSVSSTALLLDRVRNVAPETPVVLASSAAVYGGGHEGPIALDVPLTPVSPYGYHKVMAEDLGRSFAEAYGTRVTALRLFSVYGPEITKQLLFDVCTRLAAGENPLTLGGTGNELRDWCHVSDVVELMATLPSAAAGHPRIYNVGAGHGVETARVARLLLDAWGDGRQMRFSGASRAGDPFSLIADPTSLPPGFAPVKRLEDGLAEFVAWFRSRPA